MKRSFYQKGFTEIVISVIIGIILTAGVFLFLWMKFRPQELPKINQEKNNTPKEIPTEKEKVVPSINWRSYTNKKHGIKIEIPKDWFIDETQYAKAKTLSGFTLSTIEYSKFAYEALPVSNAVIDIRVWNDPFSRFIETQFSSDMQEIREMKIISKKEMSLEGLSGKEIIYTVPGENGIMKVTDILLDYKGKTLEIVMNYWLDDSRSHTYDYIFSHIISTFRFLK